jgi:hypothetical protein
MVFKTLSVSKRLTKLNINLKITLVFFVPFVVSKKIIRPKYDMLQFNVELKSKIVCYFY